MGNRRLAVHRTIVVVDVEGFGDRRRTNPHQVAVRDGLYRALREAFGDAGIRWDGCGHEDRGDGVLILVPAEVPKGLLVESLPSALVAALHAHNGTHPGQERIRLRMALHAGEVNYDENGVTSAAVNLTFRLLDVTALKAALAGSPGVLALIASSWFFEEVVRHSAAGAAAAYRPAEVAVKETTAIGWICLPDHVDPVGKAMLERLPVVAAVPGRPPDVALRTLPRDTAAFTGRTHELDRLVAAVSQTATAGGVIGVHAVDGMAGIGKTAFAVHAAHWLAASFPDGQIFLRLHAHTAGQRPVDPAEALATLLLTTGVAPRRIPPRLEARSALWRSHLAGQKVLLVLDDAAGSEQVRPLLPGSAGCLVLVTSRRRLTALEEAVPISLGTLPPGEAARLFVRLGGRPAFGPRTARSTTWPACAAICRWRSGSSRRGFAIIPPGRSPIWPLNWPRPATGWRPSRPKTSRSLRRLTCPTRISPPASGACSAGWVCTRGPTSTPTLPRPWTAPTCPRPGGASASCTTTT